VRKQARAVQEQLRQLITEGQAEGSVRAADPDQLVRAILVYLDGLARGFTLYGPEQFHQHFPDAEILLSMLRP
jgi:Tetracyclin repressor-like, C-terminal domain